MASVTVVLIGKQGSGKSQLLNMIKNSLSKSSKITDIKQLTETSLQVEFEPAHEGFKKGLN